MSFLFPSWSTAFSPAFHEDAKAMLEAALNKVCLVSCFEHVHVLICGSKGNKPPVIQGRIEVVQLSMGTQPPMLTLLEIGDLSLDRFRGILRLGYQGDAWLEVRCRVQANPLSHNPNLLPSSTLPLLTPLLASQPLLVPMTLRLSRLHLRAILILVISASKGITLVFKNDPLQNVDVSSTFDSVEVIRGYLQQEIEGQLREMFREDLPGIIHRLSQRWFTGTGMGGKVELPYKDPEYAPSASGQDEDEADLNEDTPPPYNSSPSNANLTPRRRAIQKAARERRLSTAASESPTSYTVFHDIEDYDPTYGLRPEGLPTHSGYEAFGRLWEKAREGEGRGLGGLMAPSHLGDVNEHRGDVSDSDWDDAETRSFNMVEIEDSLRPMDPGQLSRPTSGQRSVTDVDDSVEWETFPAVGGGLVTRPRVYHSQSQIRAPSEVGGGAVPSPSGTATGGSVTARASSVGGASSSMATLKMRHPQAPTSSLHRSNTAGPGPSSLRRHVTSRSDVFTTLPYQPARSETFAALPTPKSSHTQRSALSRRQSATAASSSAARTSGSSWETDKGPTRSGTMSTLASSQLPSSKSMSVLSKTPPRETGQHARAPSYAGTSPGTRHLGPGGITLPLNNSVSQLATLSHSNHTLSPYARGHEHIAVRSFPHLGRPSATGSGSSGGGPSLVGSAMAEAGRGRIKARRKRIYHLGSKPAQVDEPLISPDLEAPLRSASEWDEASYQHRRSFGSASGSDEVPRPLLGLAQRVMLSPSGRPSYGRAPDSRSSYGFPPAMGIGRIAE